MDITLRLGSASRWELDKTWGQFQTVLDRGTRNPTRVEFPKSGTREELVGLLMKRNGESDSLSLAKIIYCCSGSIIVRSLVVLCSSLEIALCVVPRMYFHQ